MMLSAHTDQENLAAAHQQAAAAKPLNAGTRAFAAKTPANKAPKTPFKVALNDENGTARAGRAALNTVGKGAENQLLPTGKKGAKVDNNAFVTPAGPRTRAPLGMKTTNAKAAAFATPAPQTEPDSEKAGVRSSGPRLRRAKVKVHQASPAVELAHDGERDIEYMPPQEIPLPDDPDDWPSDMQYPQLEGENLMRGIYQVYYDPVDDDGIHLSDKRIAEQKAKVNASHEAMLQRNIEETLGPFTDEERELFGIAPTTLPRPQATTVRPASVSSTSKPSTAITRRPLSAAATSRPAAVASRTVASALANTRNPTASMRAHARSRSALSTAAPPTAAQPRQKPTAPVAPRPSNPSNMRHQAATAASRTTLGYGKGRTISSSIRRPLGVSSGNQQRSVSEGTTGLAHSASTASGRPVGSVHPRSAWSRHVSVTTSVADARSQDENDDPEMEMIREMALRNLRLTDRLGGDDWFSRAQSGSSAFDIADEEEDFQFTIPEA